MLWIRKDLGKIPVKSWCENLGEKSIAQASDLANHPAIVNHLVLMPDCHPGYGMPIGGVAACKNALIPNGVGVDIGCGMCAVRSNIANDFILPEQIRTILNGLASVVPLGEGHAHKSRQEWEGMEARCGHLPGGIDKNAWDLAYRNIGTLGGGNHFIEIQKGSDGFIWIMIHSGSRNLGYRIAEYYHRLAFQLNQQQNIVLPDSQLAFLTADSQEGVAYIRDMLFALDYARENRMAIIQKFKSIFLDVFKNSVFTSEINIHHNYASLEKHFGEELWIHRKGATSARVGEKGIIPGSMGTSSYIVEGLGNPESFASCSHGAGRKMGRAEACRTLDKHECDKAMSGIVFDGFKPARSRFGRKSKKNYDLEEAPQAYKNIDEVITAQLDLIKPIVKLFPIGVLKG